MSQKEGEVWITLREIMDHSSNDLRDRILGRAKAKPLKWKQTCQYVWRGMREVTEDKSGKTQAEG